MGKLPVVCCSVLKREVEHILIRDFPSTEPIFLDSMLHMKPQRLELKLEALLHKIAEPTLVIYGECELSIHSIEERHRCERTQALNCCELLAGKEKYTSLQKELAFILLPEWTERWKEVFQKELGFYDRDLARSFMHEYRKSIVYLDSGHVQIPEKTLTEIGMFFDMDVRVETVSCEHLKNYIEEAISRLFRRFT